MNKIDFAAIISVKNANPNGDPLTGNMPRIDNDYYGEMTDVCIKRKIRNYCMDNGIEIYIQPTDNTLDGFTNLKARADSLNKTKDNEFKEAACKKWFDVRAFGQLFAYKGTSIGIRGPVSIQSAFSVDPVNITSTQITKSVSTKGKNGSDTMGMKHRVDFGIYVFYGSISPQLAERTGFNIEDAKILKSALVHMLDNDMSTARPAGSMEVVEVMWCEHDSKIGQYSTAEVHQSLKIEKIDPEKTPNNCQDYKIEFEKLEGLEYQNKKDILNAEIANLK